MLGKIIVSVIAAVLGLGFIIYGIILIRVLVSSSTVNVRSVVSFTAVAVTCAPGLLVQCGVLLYTTFAPRQSQDRGGAGDLDCG